MSVKRIAKAIGLAKKSEQPNQAKVPRTSAVGPVARAWTRVAEAVERMGLVWGDKAVRGVQNVTHASTLGQPNPSAGISKPPVILIAGQGDDAKQALGTYARSLQRDGFKVYVFDDPEHALEGHEAASEKLDQLVEQVRRDTGSAKVNLVGYSTGGTNARAYVNLFGGAAKVDRVVQLAGTNNGDPSAFGFAQSGREEKAGSQFMRDLNAHPADVPIYSIFEHQTDGAVQEDDARLPLAEQHHNLELPQAQRSGGGFIAWSDHVKLPYDERAYAKVIEALTAK